MIALALLLEMHPLLEDCNQQRKCNAESNENAYNLRHDSRILPGRHEDDRDKVVLCRVLHLISYTEVILSRLQGTGTSPRILARYREREVVATRNCAGSGSWTPSRMLSTVTRTATHQNHNDSEA